MRAGIDGCRSLSYLRRMSKLIRQYLNVASVLVLMATGASAAPTITQLTPPAGYPWGGTQVRITGTDLLGEAFVSCYAPYTKDGDCPVKVFFGGSPADVIEASPNGVLVVTTAHAPGMSDVVVRVAGRPDASLSNAFEFNDLASEGSRLSHFFIPVSASNVPGANGSMWNTELTVHNPTAFNVPILGSFCEATQGDCEGVLA